MSRLIILEGADCTGKTTLAKALALAGFSYQHSSGNPKLLAVAEEYHMAVLESAKVCLNCGQNVVLDRHWVSEVVYAEVMGRETLYQWKKIRDELTVLPVLYVHCNSPSAITRMVAHSNEHTYTTAQFKKIEHRYNTLMYPAFLGGPVMDYVMETDGKDLEAYICRLLTYGR